MKFDYPLIEEDIAAPISKTLLLESHTDWEYANSHVSELITEFKQKPYSLDNIYAETSPFGVIIHYRTTNTNGKLLWTGSSTRDFTVVAITQSGLVLLNKNRNSIILQLMKGDTPVSFKELTITSTES